MTVGARAPGLTESMLAAFRPLSPNAKSYALSVSTSDANVTLEAGTWALFLATAVPCGVFCQWNATAVAPTNGGGAKANTFGFQGISGATIDAPSSLSAFVLHVILTSGTDTLYLVKIA